MPPSRKQSSQKTDGRKRTEKRTDGRRRTDGRKKTDGRARTRLHGNWCIRSASLLSFIAFLILIFVHVGQLSTSTVARHMSMAQLNVSGYGEALSLLFNDPITDLYTDNASSPLGVGEGLRQVYKFGIYGYCAYVDGKNGTCANRTAAARFQPYGAIISDMVTNYSQFTDAIIVNSTFRNDGYLGSSSHGAYYMILLGTIIAFLATAIGLYRRTFSFLISTILVLLGSLFLIIGAAIWTVAIKKAQSVNIFMARSGDHSVPLGLTLTVGSSLYLVWAGAAFLLASVVPYVTSCCTFRGYNAV